MTLDDAVKISHIATPIVVVILGSIISIFLNKHVRSGKLTSHFNTKWSDEFINLCRAFNDRISELNLKIHDSNEWSKRNYAIKLNSDKNIVEEVQQFRQEFNSIIKDIMRQKYNIDINSSLMDDAIEILTLVEKIFELSSQYVEGLTSTTTSQMIYPQIEIQECRKLQRDLNLALKRKQKLVLEL